MSEDQARRRDVPEFVDEALRIGTAQLVSQFQAPEDRAREVMAKIVAEIIGRFARTTMYVPAGFDSRNEAIWTEYGQRGASGAAPYTAARIDEIAASRGITARQVRNILAVMKAAEMARRQGHLPGFDQAE